jgi:hypothetical protein
VTDYDDTKALLEQLHKMAFETDIRACLNAGAVIGTFILVSCYVDYLAMFWAAARGEIQNGWHTGEHYKQFVREFLPAYDAAAVYDDLRCKMVHEYFLGARYALRFKGKGSHLQVDHKHPNKVHIDLESFVSDVEEAAVQLKNRILGKQEYWSLRWATLKGKLLTEAPMFTQEEWDDAMSGISP